MKATPTTTTRRLPALDVLRGIAILGTLLTNIWIFSNAGMVIDGDDPTVLDEAGRITQLFDTALGLVTDGKFIGLLTIMFGIGLEIQRQAALRRGQSWPGRYPWRAGILVLDGLLNYIFIFEFDVLMGYGLTALAVAAIMMTSPRAQKIWLVIGLIAHVVFTVLTTVVLDGPATYRKDEVVERFVVEGRENIPALDGMGVGTDSYWAMVQHRLHTFLEGRAEIPIMFFMGLGLFLVGAHLYRAGIFEPAGRKLRRWTMLLSFGIGLPIDWTLRLFYADQAGGITRYITSSMVAFGVLAAVAAWYVHRSDPGPVGTGLSAVGRMALTCYIAQNLIASIIFYDWGFGVAAKIAGPNMTWWTMLIFAGIAAGLMVFSLLWLSRFRRGPVEWLWHQSFEGVGRLLDRRRARSTEPAKVDSTVGGPQA
ncbi:DUF418 domain-containing protein [Enemella sp. A6]|uniref:DUF418 domain-containing protein n=1 Tax=Enemella sp. A6 TaxID=3440152 RepID=UPI003EC14C8F